jgi:hypothetical protein
MRTYNPLQKQRTTGCNHTARLGPEAQAT